MIVGKKYLDANWYQDIIIDGNLIIVLKDEYISKCKNNSFTEGLKGLDIETQKDIIIEYFLDYNKIAGIEIFEGKNKKCVIVTTNDNKMLFINSKISEYSAWDMIIKYNLDRYEALFDNNIQTYEIYISESSFGYNVNNGIARISLVESNGELVDMDKAFLKDLLGSLFIERPYIENFEYTEETFPWESFADIDLANYIYQNISKTLHCIGGCKKQVIISPEIIKYAREVMYDYNEKNRNSEMKLQIKMEEF